MERRSAIEQAVAHLPLMLTVEEARAALGIGRSLAYGEVRRYLASDGREGIPAIRIGSAIRVPRAGLVDLLLSAPAPESHSVERHAVSPPSPPRTSRRRRSPRSTGNGIVAQLSFAEPSGS
jgi:hypothetical protein